MKIEPLAGMPPGLRLHFEVRLQRLTKRICRRCRRRRMTYVLSAVAPGPVVVDQTPLLCAECAGIAPEVSHE